MSDRMKVDLTVGPSGHTGKILLDGIDISHAVRAVTIQASVDELTTCTVELIGIDLQIEANDAVIEGVCIPLRSVDDPGDEEAA